MDQPAPDRSFTAETATRTTLRHQNTTMGS